MNGTDDKIVNDQVKELDTIMAQIFVLDKTMAECNSRGLQLDWSERMKLFKLKLLFFKKIKAIGDNMSSEEKKNRILILINSTIYFRNEADLEEYMELFTNNHIIKDKQFAVRLIQGLSKNRKKDEYEAISYQTPLELITNPEFILLRRIILGRNFRISYVMHSIFRDINYIGKFLFKEENRKLIHKLVIMFAIFDRGFMFNQKGKLYKQSKKLSDDKKVYKLLKKLQRREEIVKEDINDINFNAFVKNKITDEKICIYDTHTTPEEEKNMTRSFINYFIAYEGKRKDPGTDVRRKIVKGIYDIYKATDTLGLFPDDYRKMIECSKINGTNSIKNLEEVKREPIDAKDDIIYTRDVGVQTNPQTDLVAIYPLRTREKIIPKQDSTEETKGPRSIGIQTGLEEYSFKKIDDTKRSTNLDKETKILRSISTQDPKYGLSGTQSQQETTH